MRSPFSVESRVRCEVRLNELSPADLANLTEFAERRLVALGLNPSAGDDATQHALMAILQGMESDQGGRKPRPVDLENKDTFVNFVRGVISSIIEGMGRKRQFRMEHKVWEDGIAVASEGAEPTPCERAEVTDLRDQLFPRLRARAPKRLRRTIDAWEAVFTQSDRIPARGHRRNVGEVKDLAQQVISELGGLR